LPTKISISFQGCDVVRIALTILGLTSGGAERVMVLLAQGLLQRGHDVTVITFAHEETDFYTLPTGVDRISLNLRQQSPTPLHGIFNTLLRLVRLRQAIQRTDPDVVISFMTTMNTFTGLALLHTQYPVIATQHNSPKMLAIAQPWKALMSFVYRRIAKIVSVSHDVDQDLDWLPPAQRAVIYNPFLPVPDMTHQLTVPIGVDPNKKWLISMGRLTHQKGFDLLLSAFQRVAPQHPDWQLLILGEGELRADLEALRDRLGLSEQAVFLGAINPPFPFLQHAKLFVMASRFEGFPMAHGEALACGLPVIATRCSGVGELVRDGVDGLLVPNGDVEALASAMNRVMSDDSARQALQHRTTEVLERFGLDRILDQWEKLSAEILQER
jgi:glycosyltransferase involved in cell wall biosynthesis